jgi:hypothetical protein
LGENCVTHTQKSQAFSYLIFLRSIARQRLFFKSKKEMPTPVYIPWLFKVFMHCNKPHRNMRVQLVGMGTVTTV